MIYLDYRERCKDMNDHCSYVHKVNSSEINPGEIQVCTFKIEFLSGFNLMAAKVEYMTVMIVNLS